MDRDLQKLYDDRKECLALDFEDAWLNKIFGQELAPGDKIKIVWTGDILEGVEDEGYLFQLPMCDDDPDMLDFFVHIPNPDNSGGIGDAPQEFVHFISLLSNPLIRNILNNNKP